MQPTLEKSNYPVFEANQVLSNRHLNQVFDYLDEQERLTRANLIGIGIACGLEISLGGTAAAPEVRIGRGCGVTSEGYLIVEPKDLVLESYKTYALPLDVDYPPLKGMAIWEMFEEGEPNATLFSANPAFLNDKVVLLFLELKKDSLRNCSPTNCDDRGAEVTLTVRRLLVSKNDEQKVLLLLDGTLKLDPNQKMTLNDYETSLLLELNLPDLRLPRYDVPAGPLSSSNVVLSGFFNAIRKANLATHLGNALSASYNAFKPVVQDIYPTNPFVNFNDGNHYGFLNSAPTNTLQVRFLQYYYDLFDDLIKAYDEFRWKGVELMCACCPPSELFPRHLMLGLAHPELDTGAAIYRHYFRASSAISGCEKHTEELQQLFRRLVEMTERFTNDPPLPVSKANSSIETQIRVTPSKLGDMPLFSKCIPYYYTQDGTPRLFQLWSPEKTQRRKADQNLSYRADEYAVADFARGPLLYDLEPHNFLRVEGHLGKNWRRVLDTLISLRNQYRLPIEIIALRTGAFDEKMPVDLSKENCRFEDLEALYDATREQWLGFLCKELTYLYGLEGHLPTSSPPDKHFTSKFPFINKYAPGFKVDPSKLGGRYETGSSQSSNLPSNIAKATAGTAVFDTLFYQLFDRILALAGTLPENLTTFNYATFEAKHKSLQETVTTLETDRESQSGMGNLQDPAALLAWEETDDRLEDLMYSCRTEAFKSINDEYVRRVREVKQKQFLSNFLLKHPGIQHKAGVPVGGTFILVYHDDPEIIRPPFEQIDLANENLGLDFALPFSPEIVAKDENYAAQTGQSVIFTHEVEQAFVALQTDPVFALNPNFNLLVGALSGQILDTTANFDLLLNNDANAIIAQYVNGLPDGTVIADFFLPYLCCSDCAGIQYVLARAPLTFTFTVDCANANDEAEVSIMPAGGAPPYSYKLEDSLGYRSLAGVKSVVLKAGTHTLTVRDSEDTESAPQTFEIKSKITLGAPQYVCTADGKFYKVSFLVSGGVGSYTANQGAVAVTDNKYTSNDIASGTKADIVITDGNGCSEIFKAEHTCAAPLDFSVELACMDDDAWAPAMIKVSGGVPGYEISVDGGAKFAPLLTPHKLPVGEYTVIIRDSKGAKNSKTVKVRERLKAVVLPNDYKCIPGSTNYQAAVTVTGGTPPYKIDGKTIDSSKVLLAKMFASGTTTTMKVTDDAGCEAIVTIQHSCINKQPTVDTMLGKTRNNKAEITLTPEGGVEPYEVDLGDGKFKILKNPIVLPHGEHTLTVRDAKGTVYESKKITVPPSSQPLVMLAAPQFRCEAGKYIASLPISGGIPPYKVLNEGAGFINADGFFESAPIASGTAATVEVGDSDGNVMSIPLQHDCPAPCDKPCGGISQKCSYRLWIQPGPSPFEIYRPGEVEFTFTDEKGKTKNIPGLSVAVIPEVLNKDFHGTMKALIEQINAKIEQALGAGRLVLSYAFNDGDPFARLWVEYFQCEMFSMKFNYAYAQGSPLKEYEVRYMNAKGANAALFTNLQVDAAPVQVPAFDCSVRDQCKDTRPEKVCKETLPRITFEASPSGDQVILTTSTSGVGVGAIVHWIWEVERSTEALYTGSQVVVKVPNLSKIGTTVKLIGLSKQGCFVTAVQIIPPQKIPPQK